MSLLQAITAMIKPAAIDVFFINLIAKGEIKK